MFTKLFIGISAFALAMSLMGTAVADDGDWARVDFNADSVVVKTRNDSNEHRSYKVVYTTTVGYDEPGRKVVRSFDLAPAASNTETFRILENETTTSIRLTRGHRDADGTWVVENVVWEGGIGATSAGP